MTCRRCDGLMVRERYDDLELGSAGYEVSAWRCLNCGAIVDASIDSSSLHPQDRAGPILETTAEETGEDSIRDSSP